MCPQFISFSTNRTSWLCYCLTYDGPRTCTRGPLLRACCSFLNLPSALGVRILCGCGMENGEEWPVKLSTGKRSKAYAWAHSVMLHRVDPLSFGLLTCCCLLHHLHYTQFSSSSSSLFVVRLRIGFGRRGRVRASRYFNFLFSAAVIVSSPPTTHRSHTWTLWRTEVASVLVLSMSYCLTAFCFYALSLRGFVACLALEPEPETCPNPIRT